MADQQTGAPPAEQYAQLSQATVPLHKAMATFNTKDAEGRTPIVVLTERTNQSDSALYIVAGVTLVIGLLLGVLQGNWLLLGVMLVLSLAIAGINFYRSLRVMIPEGTSAILLERGKYSRTLAPGFYSLSPFIRISHLATRREIPFDVPVNEAITADNVRIHVEALVTFSITEPFQFVFNLSAYDFDRVFQAACQNAFRAMIRGVPSPDVTDLIGHDTSELKAALSESVAPYGVTIQKVNITFVRPPADFMASQEARKLAELRHAEQQEQQELARRRQANQEELTRQAVIAEVDRDREALQRQVQVAQARRQIEELNAEAERLRLEKLQERLRDFPEAVRWEIEGAQLDIARGLAQNTRAVVQLGSAREILPTFVIGEGTDQGALSSPNGVPDAAERGAEPPAPQAHPAVADLPASTGREKR